MDDLDITQVPEPKYPHGTAKAARPILQQYFNNPTSPLYVPEDLREFVAEYLELKNLPVVLS